MRKWSKNEVKHVRKWCQTEQYNADTVVTLKDFPKISMTFAEMFENVE